MEKRKYYAYICCDSSDKKWANWLQRKLEHYKLPLNLNGQNDLPRVIWPVYNAKDNRSNGIEADEMNQALFDSMYLIVICSPRAAKSNRIEKTLQTFIELGRSDNIIPFIVKGSPHAQNVDEECLPPVLRMLPSEKELLGVNINEMGRNAAAVKVVAQMFGIRFDVLWQRYDREQRKRKRKTVSAILLLLLLVSGFICWVSYERKQVRIKQMENQVTQAKKISALSDDLVLQGNSYLAQKLLLEVLPPNAPYTSEAEVALRNAVFHNYVALNNFEYSNVSTSFSPDGQYIAASDGKQIIIWDAKSREIQKSIPCERWEWSCACCSFSPSGNMLMYVGGIPHNRIKVLDVSNEKTAFSVNTYNSIKSAIFSPNGEHIACVLSNDSIEIMDANSGEEIKILGGHNDEISSISYCPSGRYLVSASSDSTVRIWDVTTGKVIRFLDGGDGHSGLVNSAVFSPDGKYIATASNDKTIKLWDVETGAVLRTFYGHRAAVNHVSFNPDGSLLASVSEDETVLLWDVKSGKVKKNQFDLNHHIISQIPAEFSPDGKQIMAVSSKYGIMLSEVYGPNPCGYSLIGCQNDEESFMGIIQRTQESLVVCTTCSQDGKYLATACLDGTIIIWDAERGKEICEMETTPVYYADLISGLFFDSNNRLASVSGSTIKIWDIRDGECTDSIKPREKNEWFVSISPDFKRVVTHQNFDDELYYEDCVTLVLWDRESKQNISKFLGHWDPPYRMLLTPYLPSLSFSRDGRRIITSTKEKVIIVWNADTGEPIHRLEGHSGNINSVFFNQDGTRVVSASDDKTVKVWDVEYEKEIFSFDDHKHPVSRASFSFDGKYVLSYVENGTTIIWDTEEGKKHLSLDPVDVGTVTSLCFSHDGNCFYTSCNDGSVFCWEFPPLQDLIEQTRERFKDSLLTDAERHQYLE